MSGDGSRPSAAFDTCRAGLSLALGLFALESSVTNLFAALGYVDFRLTWALWAQHLAIYCGAGLLAAAVPAVALAIGSKRSRGYYRLLLPRVMLLIYVGLLLTHGPVEIVPLFSPVLITVGLLFAVAARYGSSFDSDTPRNRRIALATGYVTWAALLYVSIAPLVASHLSKRVTTSTHLLILNVLIPAGCLVGAALVTWLLSGTSTGTGRAPMRQGRAGVSAVLLGAACYVLLAAAAVQREFPWPRMSRASATQEAGARPLDLVLIVVDSLRADRLGAYGYREARTPHLDKFAARSVRYADHVAPAPWTYPSFATLLTGRSPSSHGARRLSWPPSPQLQPGIPELGMMRADLPTLGTILKEHGYETAFIGTNWALSGAYGLARGFDFYSDLLTTDFYVTLGTLLRERHPWDRTVDAEEMTERFLEYLRQKRDRPMALVAHYMDPHVPYVPPLRFRDQGEEPRKDAGARPLEVMSAERVSALYDGEVSFVDEQFGRLWNYLENTGRIGKTVVALTADHGEMLELRGEQTDPAGDRPVADSYAYRALDHGHNVYQDLLHIPFILYSPGLGPRVEQGMTRAVDVLPTLLTTLNVEVPPGLEGKNVVDGLEARLPALSESVLYGLEKKSWREGRYKLVYRSEYPEGQQYELYDLASDPRELHDLGQEQPERVHAMAARLRTYLSALSVADPAVAPIDSQTIERLRSLGYVK